MIKWLVVAALKLPWRAAVAITSPKPRRVAHVRPQGPEHPNCRMAFDPAKLPDAGSLPPITVDELLDLRREIDVKNDGMVDSIAAAIRQAQGADAVPPSPDVAVEALRRERKR